MIRRCSLAAICVLLVSFFLPQLVFAAGDTVIPEGTRIFLQLNKDLSTKKSSEGDEFDAVVTEPVYVGDRMMIPKGSVVSGSVSNVRRPGRLKGKAFLTLLFQSINIPGRGPKLPIVASLVAVEGNRGVNSEGTIEGEGSGGRDVETVLTPSLAGTGIGGLAGGGRGAAVGGGIGLAVGLATVFASRGKDIEMNRGATLDIRLDKPLSVPAEGEGTSARNR